MLLVCRAKVSGDESASHIENQIQQTQSDSVGYAEPEITDTLIIIWSHDQCFKLHFNS